MAFINKEFKFQNDNYRMFKEHGTLLTRSKSDQCEYEVFDLDDIEKFPESNEYHKLYVEEFLKFGFFDQEVTANSLINKDLFDNNEVYFVSIDSEVFELTYDANVAIDLVFSEKESKYRKIYYGSPDEFDYLHQYDYLSQKEDDTHYEYFENDKEVEEWMLNNYEVFTD